MRDTTHAATGTGLQPSGKAAQRRNRLIQIAPGPEPADTRDKAGAQRGMILALLGGGLFWAAVAAAAFFLKR